MQIGRFLVMLLTKKQKNKSLKNNTPSPYQGRGNNNNNNSVWSAIHKATLVIDDLNLLASWQTVIVLRYSVHIKLYKTVKTIKAENITHKEYDINSVVTEHCCE